MASSDDIKVLRLVLKYMDLPENDEDEGAHRRWEMEVRRVYPYGRIILTAPIGESVDIRGMSGRGA